MILVLVLLALMVISTVLVVAAGMLSSRLSRQEGQVETFSTTDSVETNLSPQSIE
jgi:hypothetical protein